MDAVLHEERLERRSKRLHPLPGPLAAIPDGAVVAVGGAAFTLLSGRAHRWTAEGYAPAEKLDHAEWLLTPPSTVRALDAGYRPIFHPSIQQ